MRQMEEARNKNKDVGDVEMLDSSTEDGDTFCILFFKEPDCAMYIMA